VNWLAFAAVAWVFLGLEKGLRDALELGSTGASPSFVFGLLTFIAISAQSTTALWAAIALGLAMDLVFNVPLQGGAGTVNIPGPHALAYVLGTQFILSLRGVMVRRNPLSMGFLALVGFLVCSATLLAIFTTKATLGVPIEWDATRKLLEGLGSSLYTGVLATLLGLVLIPLAPFLGLPSHQQRRFGRRA